MESIGAGFASVRLLDGADDEIKLLLAHVRLKIGQSLLHDSHDGFLQVTRRILDIQIGVQELPGQTKHSLAVSCLRSREIPIVHLRCICSQSLEGFPLFHPKVIGENTESGPHIATVRIIQAAELLSMHGKAGEESPQGDPL